jgi:hypothetical protein
LPKQLRPTIAGLQIPGRHIAINFLEGLYERQKIT